MTFIDERAAHAWSNKAQQFILLGFGTERNGTLCDKKAGWDGYQFCLGVDVTPTPLRFHAKSPRAIAEPFQSFVFFQLKKCNFSCWNCGFGGTYELEMEDRYRNYR